VARKRGDAYINFYAEYQDGEDEAWREKTAVFIDALWAECALHLGPSPHVQRLFEEDVQRYHRPLLQLSSTEVLHTLKPNVMALALVGPKTIVGRLNHVYLGGSFFVKCGKMMFQGKAPNLSLQLPPYVREHYTLKFLWNHALNSCSAHPPPAPMTLVRTSAAIRRVAHSLDLDALKQQAMYAHSKANIVVVHRILSELCAHVSKPVLKTYLTFGFEKDEVMYNNVGIMFLDFERGMTPAELAARIARDKYQVIATNNLMSFMPTGGKSSRRSVDVVLSLCYFTHCQTDIAYNHVSYSHVADYPVYVMAFSAMGTCRVSTTIMTPELDCDQLVRSVQGVEF
jgi:hypothetical protein